MNRKYNMKNLIIATAMASTIAAPAFAADRVNAKVTDYYKTVVQSQPYTTRECSMQQVPIYSDRANNNTAGGNALIGMIIGGLIGKGVSGNDKGAAAGAVIGGIAGADSNRPVSRSISGYRNERVCNDVTQYTNQEVRSYDYSVITWTQNGKNYSYSFNK